MNDILLTSFTNPAAQILDPTFQKVLLWTIYFNIANANITNFYNYMGDYKIIAASGGKTIKPPSPIAVKTKPANTTVK